MHWLKHNLSTNWKSDLHRLAVGGAWFFAFCSLVPLLWLGLGVSDGETNRVFGTEVNGVNHAIWGLTYAGVPGAILLWMEFLLVVGAMVATAAPRRWVPQRWRRAGHGVLISWSGLWAAGVMHLAGVNPGFFALQALFLLMLLGCTIYRARLNWNDADGDAFAPKRSFPIDPFGLSPSAHGSAAIPAYWGREFTSMARCTR
jgi:hypothetical protein